MPSLRERRRSRTAAPRGRAGRRSRALLNGQAVKVGFGSTSVTATRGSRLQRRGRRSRRQSRRRPRRRAAPACASVGRGRARPRRRRQHCRRLAAVRLAQPAHRRVRTLACRSLLRREPGGDRLRSPRRRSPWRCGPSRSRRAGRRGTPAWPCTISAAGAPVDGGTGEPTPRRRMTAGARRGAGRHGRLRRRRCRQADESAASEARRAIMAASCGEGARHGSPPRASASRPARGRGSSAAACGCACRSPRRSR